MRRSALIAACFAVALVASQGCKHPFVNSGNIYIDQGLLNKAEACFNVALDDDPNNSEAHFQLGYVLSEMAKDHMAEGLLDSARVKFWGATEHYTIAGELDSLLWADDAGLNISSNFARVFNEGAKLVTAGREAEALTYYEIAYGIEPNTENGGKALLNIVQLKYGDLRNRLLDAQGVRDAAGEAAVKTDLEHLLELIEKAKLHIQDERAERTLIDIQANALKMLDRDAEAFAIYESLLYRYPDDIGLVVNLADARMKEGDTVAAADFFGRAIDLVEAQPLLNEDGRYNYLYIEVALAFFESDEYEKAIPAFRKALETTTQPLERIRILDRIAWSHFELEQYTEAAEAAKAVTDMAPDNFNGWQIQCRSLNRLGREAEAAPACAKFQELKDQN